MTSAIDAKYEVLSAITRKKLEKINAITLTTDLWTETMTSRSYIGFTGHYLHQGKLRSMTLDITELPKEHSAVEIRKALNTMLEKWGISKDTVTAVVIDNGANVVKAVVDNFGRERHLSCFAHSLNLVVSTALDRTEGLQQLIKKVKTIVTYFRFSTKATAKLRAAQSSDNKLSPKQDVMTRWNPTFDMMQRFLILLEAVTIVLMNIPNSPPLPTSDEVAYLREVAALLEPAKDATTELSGENYVTSSRVIPMAECLHTAVHEVKVKFTMGKLLKQQLIEGLEHRFKSNILNPLLSVATMLDPRFKRMYFPDEGTKTKAVGLINKLVQENQKNLKESSQGAQVHVEEETGDVGDSIWRHHQAIIKQHQKYSDDNQVTSGGLDANLKLYLSKPPEMLQTNVIEYWMKRREDKSALSAVALKYPSVVATSVPSERLFSRAGNLVSEKRNRLSPDHISKLVFLQPLDADDWCMS